MENLKENEVIVKGSDVSLPESQTRTSFGAVNSPTPVWAKWMFRGTAILTTVIAFVVASDPRTSGVVEIILVGKHSASSPDVHVVVDFHPARESILKNLEKA